MVHNSIITDPTLIANAFNSFFANIGAEIADKIHPHPLTFLQSLHSTRWRTHIQHGWQPGHWTWNLQHC